MKRRTLKKQIRYVCGDVAGECLLAIHLLTNADMQSLRQTIVNAAELQTSTLKKVSISFDKTPSAYETRKAYNAERRKYYAKAFDALRNDFNNQLQSIVKEMNAALPKTK